MYYIMKSEDKIHTECYVWFHNTFPNLRGQLWHTPNGGHRQIVEAVKFRTMGVQRGVHDLLFLYNGKLHSFEIKNEKGRMTPEQKTFADMIVSNGGTTWLIRDVETFKKIINSIICN